MSGSRAPTPQSFPNIGIGRINTNGSLGSCSACHARHSFSSALARTSDTCGKCHRGPEAIEKVRKGYEERYGKDSFK